MRTFAQKPKSSRTGRAAAPAGGHGPEVELQKNDAAITASTCPAHDFGSIPLFPESRAGASTFPHMLRPPEREAGTAVPAPLPARFGGSSGRAQIRSGPETKLPPSPKPKEGEKSLATLKDKRTGAEQKIYASFVTQGLWWFNGGTPTLATLYPTAANIPVGGLGKGKFNVKVTAGADKVALDGGGATLTGDDLNDVTVKGLAPSAKEKDVKIEVKHRATGAKADTTNNVELEVRAPDHLNLLGTAHSAKGSHGYLSLTSLQVFDNFGKPMPFIDVNEDFTTATMEKGVSSEWKDGFGARTKGSDITRDNAVFQDQYAVGVSGTPPASMTPTPSNPLSPLGKTRVGAFTHDWYIGSATVGKGVHVSRHQGVFYSDHGEYADFKSPPKAKAPVGKAEKKATAPKK